MSVRSRITASWIIAASYRNGNVVRTDTDTTHSNGLCSYIFIVAVRKHISVFLVDRYECALTHELYVFVKSRSEGILLNIWFALSVYYIYIIYIYECGGF